MRKAAATARASDSSTADFVKPAIATSPQVLLPQRKPWHLPVENLLVNVLSEHAFEKPCLLDIQAAGEDEDAVCLRFVHVT